MAASAGDSHSFPIYNARYRVVFPILDADGDLVTGATGLDSELSQDQGTFADATNEATEIATSSGMYYLDLISTEMDVKSVGIIVKTSSSGAKTTPMVIYPVQMAQLRTGTAQAGAATTITLDSGASGVDNFYAGCYVNITNNSPANALGQARLITSYVGSTKVATVEAAWGTNPSSASTFEVLCRHPVSVVAWAGGAVPDPNASGYPIVTIKDGTGTGEIDTTAGGVLVAAVATDAIGASGFSQAAADKVWLTASRTLTAFSFAVNISAAAVQAVWDALTSALTTVGSIGKLLVDNINATISSRASAAALATVQADTDDIQTRLPAALVSGRIDASVGAMAASTVTAAAVATGAIDADALAIDAVVEIADGLLDRDMSVGTDSGTSTVRTVRQALRVLRNRFSISGTTRSVYRENDTTVDWTSTLQTDAAADPIVGDDPQS